MKNFKIVMISLWLASLTLIQISHAADMSLLLENNAGDQFELSVKDKKLMDAALNDMGFQYYLYGEKLSQRQSIEGSIQVEDVEYWYAYADGDLQVYADNGKPVTKIPVRDVIEAIVQTNNPGLSANRCPWCLIVGIIVAQGTCAASAGAEHLYCQSTCECGVAETETSCFLGFRETTCKCQPCPTDPSPGSEYPLPGGGSLFGTPWWQDNNNDNGNGYPLCVNPTIDGQC
ncbi:hypothetical protein [Marinicella sp. W31]|uniref:hypothetical protein n=1 Tax=Marinicella sp. W31 TaxID=3023713 RepID=UPI0037570ABA